MMSSGIAMETHYCMGQQAGVDIYRTSESKCRKCGMTEEKGGCCRDEHRLYKMSSEHKIAAASYVSSFTALPVSVPVFSFTPFLPAGIYISLLSASPPDISRPDICISNCIFRI